MRVLFRVQAYVFVHRCILDSRKNLLSGSERSVDISDRKPTPRIERIGSGGVGGGGDK